MSNRAASSIHTIFEPNIFSQYGLICGKYGMKRNPHHLKPTTIFLHYRKNITRIYYKAFLTYSNLEFLFIKIMKANIDKFQCYG